jgi:hypothetical protein
MPTDYSAESYEWIEVEVESFLSSNTDCQRQRMAWISILLMTILCFELTPHRAPGGLLVHTGTGTCTPYGVLGVPYSVTLSSYCRVRTLHVQEYASHEYWV